MNIALIVACTLIAVWVGAILSIEVLNEKAGFWDSIFHVGTVLLMVAVIFRDRFVKPAKDWIVVVLEARDLLPGGRRKSDPPEPPKPGAP
jgi:hypothetical protein